MAQEMGTGALLKVRHGMGREKTFYGGSVHLTKASQKNLNLARRSQLNTQNDKEYQFEVKQIYHKRWNLKQHLQRLRREKEHVTYLDGGSRGKPRSQWDTSIDDVRVRHARTMQHIPYSGVSKSDESLNITRRENTLTSFKGFPDQPRRENTLTSFKGFPDQINPSRMRSLRTASSEDSLHLGISGKPPVTMETKHSFMRLPSIHDNQKINLTRSDDYDVTGRPVLRHSNTTLEHLATRRKSRSLTDLKDFRDNLKSAV